MSEPYRDLSPFFREVWVVRHSSLAQRARLDGAAFSLFAQMVDMLRLPRFVAWLVRATSP
jgi:hypothetical protein